MTALTRCGVTLGDVRLLASGAVKADEAGLIAAARDMRLPLRFVSMKSIRESTRTFTHSSFVQEHVGVPAVAEPAALLAGRRTELWLPKTVIGGVTVAVAKEDCSSLE